WFVDGSYLRVKNMQIGYSIPSNITKAIGIFSARLSISGSNLFTWANERLNGLDPEAPDVSNGYYPQQKTYSAGLNITF
ncbi:MAG: TonB-dependent receptor, partial [Paludibacter sp.]|nr:TonB-dependent receptor [Paludibacter sp.]